jgi:putative hemolysin
MTYLILLLLIVSNAFFSLAEVALISVREAELKQEENQHNRHAAEVLSLIKNPAEFLSAIQVGITLVGILEGIYGGSMVAVQLDHLMVAINLSHIISHNVTLVIAIAVITYLSIVFGELVPKSIALQIPLKVSLWIAPVLTLLSRILYPFIKILTLSTTFILSAAKFKNSEKKITEDDIKQILSAAYKQGNIEKQQYWMQENVISFNSLTARRMMKVARLIACIPFEWNNDAVKKFIREKPYSYFPVYTEDKNHITGMINTKQFFLHEARPWQESMVPYCTIPEKMPARELLSLFKEKKSDFGVVVNDQNIFIGVVTMQDIMESIFGDLPEHEDFSAYIYEVAPRIWMAEDFIHLQRVRVQLNLSWIRQYESKYINLQEFMSGESAVISTPLVINGVSFELLPAEKNGMSKIKIILPTSTSDIPPSPN